MAIYVMAILVAPVLGPTLGGWITDNYSWRWIFYINLPVGVLSLVLSGMLLEDPPYLKAQRAERKGKPIRVDFIGLGLLSVGLASLELVLDKGQTHDWFGSPFIVRMSILAAVGLVGAVVWELNHRDPIVNLRVLKERNFLFASITVFSAFIVVYGSTALLPQLLQSLMGYTALSSGLVLSPAGLVTMIEMPIVGIMLSKGVDARRLCAVGLITVGTASFWLSGLSLEASAGHVIWPRVVQMMGMALVIVPINTVAFGFLPKEQVNNASGLFNLIRNEGSSFGVALSNMLIARRQQFHHHRLAEHLDTLNPTAREWLNATALRMLPRAGSWNLARRQALGMLDGLVQKQSSLLSFLDLFWLFGVLTIVVVPMAFLMKRAVATKESLAVH